MTDTALEDAFNSMLRTDYIPLNDTDKLNLLASYYVDYMGYLGQILGPNDQLIVGRRGTGKTTLLYRALVECMRSWDESTHTKARPRTLGIYLDLEKCQTLAGSTSSFDSFEHAFVTELCEAMTIELTRSWSALTNERRLFGRLFKSAENKQRAQVDEQLSKLAGILQSGLPRFVDRSGPVETRDLAKSGTALKAGLGVSGTGTVNANIGAESSDEFESESTGTQNVFYRLSVSDILRVIGDLRTAAGIPMVILFIDEFSSLDAELQGKFTTLLKKILGNHAGLYVKLCAITDNYRLGSSIILQRDLFEMPLDLDAFVERSGSITVAMTELEALTRNIVSQRLQAYSCPAPDQLFDAPDQAWQELTRAAMGVPRTLGIVLREAWHRSRTKSSTGGRVRRTDIDGGIRYASRAYLNQMLGASRDGIAIPQYVSEIWDSLVERAIRERSKAGGQASHFMVLPKNEERLKYLSMCFLVHLVEEGRTTKKEKLSRSLYCFDYGVCLENNLTWEVSKNIIRQQRFAYDDALRPFDHYFTTADEPRYHCKTNGHEFRESELQVAGTRLAFCPHDKSDLLPLGIKPSDSGYTEEEIKIIGAMRMADRGQRLEARQIADDVGCYVQKVAKFGAKLERDGVIEREKIGTRYIYFSSAS